MKIEKMYQIPTHSKFEHRATIAALMAIGYVHKEGLDLDRTVKALEDYLVVVVYTEEKHISGNFSINTNPKCGSLITLTDFLKLIDKTQPVFVVLSEKYIAEITCDGVKVGCATFPFSVVKELAKEVEKFEQAS